MAQRETQRDRQEAAREAEIQRDIMAALGALDGVVVSRNNVGVAQYGGARVEYGVGGKGAPDLLVEVRVDIGRPSFAGFAWVALWLEVKTETGALSKDQVRWHAAARSLGRHVAVVRSVEEARRAVAHARGEVFRG